MPDAAPAPLRVRAPGKLLVLGEYGVLDPDHWAAVLAVDRHVTVDVEPAEGDRTLILDCPQLGLEGLTGTIGRASPRWGKAVDAELFRRIHFVHYALTLSMWVSSQAGATLHPFRIRVESGLGHGKAKAGLGGSAAVVSGVVSAVIAWAGLDLGTIAGRARALKAAALAHFMGQEKRGSGADVAASVLGGLLAYRNPGLGDLMRSVDPATGMPGLIDRVWPRLQTNPVLWPEGHVFLSAATGQGASTPRLVSQLEGLEGADGERYDRFKHDLARIAHDALADPAAERLGAAMRAHQERIDAFEDELGGAGIVTADLERALGVARALDVPVKVSGAGGGDSVIALVARERRDDLRGAWEDAGFVTLEVDRPVEGLTVDRGAGVPA